MLKQVITFGMGLMIGSSAVAAADLSGVYTGESGGQNMAVQLQESNGVIQGVVQFGSARLPLAGREQDGRVQGVWQAPNGQQFPFAATSEGGSLVLETNGARYQLERGEPAAPGAVALPAAQRADVPPVEMVQGQIFSEPVPRGWNRTESSNETFVIAPDGTMGIGFVGIERVAMGSPVEFLQYCIVNVYKMQDFKVERAEQIRCQQGEEIEALISYSANGQPLKAWTRVVVMRSGGYGNGYLLIAAASPEKFEGAIAGLKALSEKIQITNGSAAFQRDQALAAQRSRPMPSLNHPMDDTVTSGYWARQKTLDNVAQRDSDVRRDTYVSTDPSTGQQYYHGQSAYDPTRGGVVNPERPDELLTPADHWAGR